MTDPARLRLTVGTFLVLGLVQSIWPLSMDLYLPAFPGIADDLAVEPAAVQATLTAAFIGMAIGQLLAGPWSDRVGRMRPMTTALAIYIAGSVACALAPTAPLLVGARFAQGLGAAGASVLTIAIVRDATEGGLMVRALARLQIVNGTFVVLAPSMGAYLLLVVPWRGLFWILAAFGVALIIVTLAVLRASLREPTHGRDGAPRPQLYRPLARDRRYLLLACSSALLFASMMAYMASSAFLFQETFGLSEQTYALIFGGHGLVMILGAQISARVAVRLQPMRVAVVGTLTLVCTAATGIALSATTGSATLWAFVTPLFVYTAAFGFTGPALATSVLRDHRERAGAAASIEGAGRMVFGAVAAPVAGALGATNPVAIFSVMLVIVGIAATLVAMAAARSGRDEAPEIVAAEATAGARVADHAQ